MNIVIQEKQSKMNSNEMHFNFLAVLFIIIFLINSLQLISSILF